MVHQYKNNGYNIVLDVCSGSVHVVDDLVYDMIAMYKDKKFEEIEQAILEKYGDTYSKEDIKDAYSDISELEERNCYSRKMCSRMSLSILRRERP